MTGHVTTRDRRLKPGDDVFSHNAWDDLEWTDEMYQQAEERLSAQKNASNHPDKDLDSIESNVETKWNDFYKVHGDKFFKDRQWIFSEFPEILECIQPNRPECRLLEVGCGVGNAVVHILKSNQNDSLHIYCCDLSEQAIDILQQRDFYQLNRDKITAFQANVCTDFEDIICKNIPDSSLDFILLIFTLSALKPESMIASVSNIAKLLKPNGFLLFRDYARYDLAQLRFKSKSYLGDNYYMRSDGTTSYFFTKEVVDNIFTTAGLIKVQLTEDKRMLVNRARSLKMCRCWIQGKFMKPSRPGCVITS